MIINYIEKLIIIKNIYFINIIIYNTLFLFTLNIIMVNSYSSYSPKDSKIIFSFSFYSGQCAQSKYKNNNDFQDGSAPKCLFIHRFKMN